MLLPLTYENSWIKDFPSSVLLPVLTIVFQVLPNAVDLCKFLDVEVIKPLFEGNFSASTEFVMQRAQELLSPSNLGETKIADDQNGPENLTTQSNTGGGYVACRLDSSLHPMLHQSLSSHMLMDMDMEDDDDEDCN